MYWVYVLRNPEGTLYVGFTTNLEQRVRRHQQGDGGWTRHHGPWVLVYHEAFTDRVEALGRERNWKRGRTNQELHRRFGNTPA